MSNTDLPEALRLAAWFDSFYLDTSMQAKAAAELRRLQAENEALRKCAVKYLTWLNIKDPKKSLESDLFDPEMLV